MPYDEEQESINYSKKSTFNRDQLQYTQQQQQSPNNPTVNKNATTSSPMVSPQNS